MANDADIPFAAAADRRAEDLGPYAPNAPGWDETGTPIGKQIGGHYALDWQHEANRRAAQRRQALWGDAHQAMRQGLNLFQSYRPGGSAALASGTVQNQSSLYATQALNTDAPDLMIQYRQEQADKARRDAKKMAIGQFLKPLSGGVPGLQPDQTPPPSAQDTGSGGIVPPGSGGAAPGSGGAGAGSGGAGAGYSGAGAGYSGAPGLPGSPGDGGSRSAGLGGSSGPGPPGGPAGGPSGGVSGSGSGIMSSGGGGVGGGSGSGSPSGVMGGSRGSLPSGSPGPGQPGGVSGQGITAGPNNLPSFGGADVARAAGALSPAGQQMAILGAKHIGGTDALTSLMESSAFSRAAAAAGQSAAAGGAAAGGAATGGAVIGGGAASTAALALI